MSWDSIRNKMLTIENFASPVFTGVLKLNTNDSGINGVNTSGTAYNLIKFSSNNRVEIGDATQPLRIASVASPQYYDGTATYNIYTSKNLTISNYAPLASPTFTGNVTSPTFTSTVATGTAPLTITSTTKVANLNADLLDGIDSTGFIQKAIYMPSGADFNSYTTEGEYYNSSSAEAATMVNRPTSLAFNLKVTKHAGYNQEVTEYSADSTFKTYRRNYYNGGWSAWYQVYHSGADVASFNTVASVNRLKSGSWGAVSTGTDGRLLLGHNSYYDGANNVYKYLTSHASLGARGITIHWGGTLGLQPYFFNMGDIAATADATFTPSLNRMWHEGNDGLNSGLDADFYKGVNLFTQNQQNHSYAVGLTEAIKWKNYGNSHVLFDASAGTAPNGSAVDASNAQNAWVGSYGSLMGWNGANTFGVRVDSSRTADGIKQYSASAPGSYLGEGVMWVVYQ